MKFVVSVVHKDDSVMLLNALAKQGYRVTSFESAGGFQRKGNMTLFAGVEDDQVDEIVSLIRQNCQSRTQRVGSLPAVMESGKSYVLEETEEVEAGGTVIFVLDVDQFFRA